MSVTLKFFARAMVIVIIIIADETYLLLLRYGR